ncbi:hypothetical protein AVEN_248048-1 [Araneus ventricosus]|uniref:Uncharacterized protein n=1 Tax=Araneus ventricosus TaxID=182803 RepID=A0A4Y2HKL2_ARAVE|nr:hypothetical protein AVEN_248048-1 [Araneus ventricosus]
MASGTGTRGGVQSGANKSSNFCCRCSTKRHSYVENTAVSLSRVRRDPDLLKTVPSCDHCYQHLRRVDASLPNLSAILRKENPPSCSPFSRLRSNSVSYQYCIFISLRVFLTHIWLTMPNQEDK